MAEKPDSQLLLSSFFAMASILFAYFGMQTELLVLSFVFIFWISLYALEGYWPNESRQDSFHTYRRFYHLCLIPLLFISIIYIIIYGFFNIPPKFSLVIIGLLPFGLMALIKYDYDKTPDIQRLERIAKSDKYLDKGQAVNILTFLDKNGDYSGEYSLKNWELTVSRAEKQYSSKGSIDKTTEERVLFIGKSMFSLLYFRLYSILSLILLVIASLVVNIYFYELTWVNILIGIIFAFGCAMYTSGAVLLTQNEPINPEPDGSQFAVILVMSHVVVSKSTLLHFFLSTSALLVIIIAFKYISKYYFKLVFWLTMKYGRWKIDGSQKEAILYVFSKNNEEISELK